LLKQIIKCSAIQCENVTEDMLHPVLQHMFKMMSLYMDTSWEMSSPLFASATTVHQTRLHSDTAAFVISNV